jgi:hypothetical protein
MGLAAGGCQESRAALTVSEVREAEASAVRCSIATQLPPAMLEWRAASAAEAETIAENEPYR